MTEQQEAIELWGLDKSLDLETEVATFYVLYEAHLDKPSLRKVFIQRCERLAFQLSNYTDAALGGELRHYRHSKRKTLQEELQKYIFNVSSRGRYEAWGLWWAFRNIHSLEALTWAGKAFRNSSMWRKSYGGKKWALATETLHSYLSREYNEVVFLDTIFGVEHNCGPIFNKLWLTGALVGIYAAAFKGDIGSLRPKCDPLVMELILKARKEKIVVQR